MTRGMGKVLLVYPHNFLDRNMGTNIRVYSLAKVLRERGYDLDLYACRNMFSSFDRWDEMNAEEKLVGKLYLYDFRQTQRYQKKCLKNRVNRLLRREELETWVTPCMLNQFRQIVSSASYNYIVMFYAYTAELLSPAHYAGGACKVYFMEDFLSMNQYAAGTFKCIGSMLDSELKRVGYFDKIACISWDEKILFEKLLADKRFYFLPHIIERNGKCSPKKIRTKKKAITALVDRMMEHVEGGAGYTGKCSISQSACREDAEEVARLIGERIPALKDKVVINNIGTVIGSHTGPGTVALFFMGDKRVD